jgi:hypothetical protein
LTDAADKEQLDRVLREITALENELTLLETQEGASRALGADVLTGAQIQRSIDADAVLLQYELARKAAQLRMGGHARQRASRYACTSRRDRGRGSQYAIEAADEHVFCDEPRP